MAEDLFSRKKAKKHKKNRPTPLQTLAESSIIGLTEAREAAGKIEGIGDVLSDGSKKTFLELVNYTNVIK